jgi:nucleoside-diphosphate-sugar epimerase
MNTNKNIGQQNVLIVGANGGLAKETIKYLIEDGFKNIVMACRTKAKGQAAKTWILNNIQHSEDLQLTVAGGFDMNNPNKIEKAVQSLNKQVQFDKVFLAAGGVVFGKDFQTIEWKGQQIERTVFQNMMGSHITLSFLKKNDLLADGVRVVMSGGEGARGIKGIIEAPHFASPEELRQYVFANSSLSYNSMNAIGASKFFGAIWTLKLAKLEAENMEVVWFTPGMTYGTDGLKGLSGFKRWFAENVAFGLMKLMGIAQSPAQGGRKFADSISGKIGKNGDLIGAPEGKALGKLTDQKPMNPNFNNPVLINEFWQILEELFGKFGVLEVTA